MSKLSITLRAITAAIGTLILVSGLVILVGPMKVSGPRVEYSACGPYAFCASGADERLDWLTGTKLVMGEAIISTESSGREVIMVSDLAFKKSIAIAIGIGLVPAIAVLVLLTRKRHHA